MVMLSLALSLSTLALQLPPGELASHHVYTLRSAEPSDRFGAALARVGDADGDGIGDVVVGAPQADPGGASSGRVTLFSGASGGVLWTFEGQDPVDRSGWSVADAGDVNGDGLDDVLIGAPLGTPSSGEARVLSGVDGSTLWVFSGAAPGAGFGTAVAGLGDVDADGRPDLAVGAPFDPGAGRHAGSVSVFSGATGRLLWTRVGAQAWGDFGASLDRLGDLDGDGLSELVVGAPFDDTSGFNAGAVQVLSGATGATLMTLTGEVAGDRFGAGVRAAGDVNGDGIEDLVITAPSADARGFDAGAADVRSGLDGTRLLLIAGEAAGEFLAAADGAGDVDGDGRADLLVGSSSQGPGEAGRVRVLSGADGAELLRLEGDQPHDWAGAAVAGLGDLDGDGWPEFGVGAPGHDDDTDSLGSVRVWTAATRRLAGDRHRLSLSEGGTLTLTLDVGASHGGAPYAVLGSAAGTEPGVALGGLVLPLNPEPTYFQRTLLHALAPPLFDFRGLLDAQGRGEARLVLPPRSDPGVAGWQLHHAFVVLEPGAGIVEVSEAVPLRLDP